MPRQLRAGEGDRTSHAANTDRTSHAGGIDHTGRAARSDHADRAGWNDRASRAARNDRASHAARIVILRPWTTIHPGTSRAEGSTNWHLVTVQKGPSASAFRSPAATPNGPVPILETRRREKSSVRPSQPRLHADEMPVCRSFSAPSAGIGCRRALQDDRSGCRASDEPSRAWDERSSASDECGRASNECSARASTRGGV